MSITVIRHKASNTGFIQVTTIGLGRSFKIWVQEYTVIGGRTTLDASSEFSSEATAIAYFNAVQR